MNEVVSQNVYGPVPSRRLGRSLGIDLIPFKICSYDCVYCQLGRTTQKTLDRQEYVPVAQVLGELQKKLAEGEKPDYITVAGSGEPTLHIGLGDLIAGIKSWTDIPVAVLTNGSLLWMREVQDSLMRADLVIPSLDAGEPRLFRCVNRPHPGLAFDQVIAGLVEFARRFPGAVWLEVFLLAGMTDRPEDVKKIAAIAETIQPARVQLNTVTRPPAEPCARSLPVDQMLILSKLFSGPVDTIRREPESYRGSRSVADDPDAEILAILRRHPCTPQDVATSLGMHVLEALKRLDGLADAGRIHTVQLEGKVFYVVTEMKKGKAA